MTEPLHRVYVSKQATPYRGSYHRSEQRRTPTATDCGKLQLAACDELTEVEAVQTWEPCSRCFILRGRRQNILNLLEGIDLEVPA